MTVVEMRCDMCGAELEKHGRRYVMSLAKLPTVRLVGSMLRYDLCETCAARIKVRMGRNQAKSEHIERWGMKRIRRVLTRLHLWIGERLGLTHYRNCHLCQHCVGVSEPALVWCDLYLEEDGVLAATDPCEAVWCDDYVDKSEEELGIVGMFEVVE